MKTYNRRFVASVVVIGAVVLAMPPTFATSALNNRDHERDVVVTFTKWVTAVVPPVPAEAAGSRFLLAGVVAGDATGSLVGEVIDRRVSTTGTISAQIVALDALYELRAADRSFTTLVHGAQNNGTHKAILDGIIVDGWRTGARVHVAYDVISGCVGKPAGPCFQGTIRVSDFDDSED
jgi:hypothetical protein